MKKYGLIKNGIVESIFYSEKEKSAYADIASKLVEISDDVECNWKYDGVKFTAPPIPITVLSPKDFFARFTKEERENVLIAAVQELILNNADLQIFLDDIKSADEINVTDKEIVQGMSFLENRGLLTPDRVLEILK